MLVFKPYDFANTSSNEVICNSLNKTKIKMITIAKTINVDKRSESETAKTFPNKI